MGNKLEDETMGFWAISWWTKWQILSY